MSSQDGPGLFSSLLHIYVNEYKIKKDKKVEELQRINIWNMAKIESSASDDTTRK